MISLAPTSLFGLLKEVPKFTELFDGHHFDSEGFMNMYMFGIRFF
jgi:hypothetical protein